MNIRLACATLAFYHQLTANGTEPDHAIDLIGDAAWSIYRKWGLLPRLIASARSHDQAERLWIPIDLFLRASRSAAPHTDTSTPPPHRASSRSTCAAAPWPTTSPRTTRASYASERGATSTSRSR